MPFVNEQSNNFVGNGQQAMTNKGRMMAASEEIMDRVAENGFTGALDLTDKKISRAEPWTELRPEIVFLWSVKVMILKHLKRHEEAKEALKTYKKLKEENEADEAEAVDDSSS